MDFDHRETPDIRTTPDLKTRLETAAAQAKEKLEARKAAALLPIRSTLKEKGLPLPTRPKSKTALTTTPEAKEPIAIASTPAKLAPKTLETLFEEMDTREAIARQKDALAASSPGTSSPSRSETGASGKKPARQPEGLGMIRSTKDSDSGRSTASKSPGSRSSATASPASSTKTSPSKTGNGQQLSGVHSRYPTQ